ncbi:MAG: hypothetical protein ABGY24_17595 [bacterium]
MDLLRFEFSDTAVGMTSPRLDARASLVWIVRDETGDDTGACG